MRHLAVTFGFIGDYNILFMTFIFIFVFVLTDLDECEL